MLVGFFAMSAAMPAPADIVSRLQAIADAKAAHYGCAISIAVQTSTDAWTVASNGSKPEEKFVWGSVTKQFTGAALLQLHDAGKIDLDAPVAPIIDSTLNQLGLASMTGLFGREAAAITSRHLAMMQSGVPDYDTAKPYPRPPTDEFRAQCYAHPSEEFGPAKLINESWVATGHLGFTPGTHTSYSSTNFALLGLVLAAVSGAPTWDAFNQGSIFDVLPPERRALYDRLIFGVHGAPSDHGAVHGYDRTSYNGANGTAPGHDVWKVAGVYGGWTASDVTASTADVARFGYDLYGSAPPQLLSNASKAIMVPQYNPHSHFPYGFATFNLTELASGRSSGGPYRTAYGHLGATYGYQSILTYYPGADVAIAVGSDIETDFQAQPTDTLCATYTMLLPLLTGAPQETCQYKASGYFGTCDCGNNYECSHLTHQCVRRTSHGPMDGGTLSKADCEATCGREA